MDFLFYPNDFVTRAEIITFLVNILKSEGITKKEALVALQNNYSDFDEIPDWFKVTAGKAEVLGVIAKEPPNENQLNYDGFISRAIGKNPGTPNEQFRDFQVKYKTGDEQEDPVVTVVDPSDIDVIVNYMD